jgi:hypothetical protein
MLLQSLSLVSQLILPFFSRIWGWFRNVLSFFTDSDSYRNNVVSMGKRGFGTLLKGVTLCKTKRRKLFWFRVWYQATKFTVGWLQLCTLFLDKSREICEKIKFHAFHVSTFGLWFEDYSTFWPLCKLLRWNEFISYFWFLNKKFFCVFFFNFHK